MSVFKQLWRLIKMFLIPAPSAAQETLISRSEYGGTVFYDVAGKMKTATRRTFTPEVPLPEDALFINSPTFGVNCIASDSNGGGFYPPPIGGKFIITSISDGVAINKPSPIGVPWIVPANAGSVVVTP